MGDVDRDIAERLGKRHVLPLVGVVTSQLTSRTEPASLIRTEVGAPVLRRRPDRELNVLRSRHGRRSAHPSLKMSDTICSTTFINIFVRKPLRTEWIDWLIAILTNVREIKVLFENFVQICPKMSTSWNPVSFYLTIFLYTKPLNILSMHFSILSWLAVNYGLRLSCTNDGFNLQLLLLLQKGFTFAVPAVACPPYDGSN